MIVTQEREILKAQQQFDSICEMVRQAGQAEQRADEVERDLFSSLLQVGHSLLEAFLRGAGDGNHGKNVEQNGKTLRRSKRKHMRRYVSVFGEHEINRFVYAPREKQRIEWLPLDERLGLPATEYSYLLQDWSQRLCVKESFVEGHRSLQELLGISVPVATLELINQKMAERTLSFREQRLAPNDDEEILVYSNDCKGVPMRRPLQERSRPHRRQRGEKANKKQMACVGTGYSIARWVRNADDVLDEALRRDRQRDRPRPQNKRVWAEMTRALEGDDSYNGKTLVFMQQAIDLYHRDPHRQKTVVCLMDGERALWTEQREWLSRCIGILDIYHVMERLWQCAYCFHREGTAEAELFFERRLRMVLEGRVGYVIGVLKRLGSQTKLTREKRRTLNAAIVYFENNQQHMKYDEYLAAGLPIGSGVAEGACRHVVKDRLEQTGMRWTLRGAQSMLDLRSTYLNDDWQPYMQFYIDREQDALYGKKAA
jgi:hypothetical protein